MASAGGAPSVIDLMLFHTTERNLFARLTHRLGLTDHDKISSVMALWLWLEAIGYHDLIRHIYSYEDDVVLRFVAEASSCLEALANPATVGEGNYEVPTMAWQLNEPMDLRFFVFNREVAVAGIGRIKQNVCRIIFDDDLIRKTAGDMSHPASRSVISTSGLIVRPFVERNAAAMLVGPENVMWQSVPRGSAPAAGASPFPARSVLNPMARPWVPAPAAAAAPPPATSVPAAAEDQRSMFITFSKGHPISRDDIMEFFTSRYGPCVEMVMIEKAPPGQRPMYGRVVFTSASMITGVLNGQRTAKFMIKGRHLWARMYVPRQS